MLIIKLCRFTILEEFLCKLECCPQGNNTQIHETKSDRHVRKEDHHRIFIENIQAPENELRRDQSGKRLPIMMGKDRGSCPIVSDMQVVQVKITVNRLEQVACTDR